MDSSVVKNFQGYIDGVGFSSEFFFDAVYMVLEKIEEKFGKNRYYSEFVYELKDLIYCISDRYDDKVICYDIARSFVDCIEKADAFTTVEYRYKEFDSCSDECIKKFCNNLKGFYKFTEEEIKEKPEEDNDKEIDDEFFNFNIDVDEYSLFAINAIRNAPYTTNGLRRIGYQMANIAVNMTDFLCQNAKYAFSSSCVLCRTLFYSSDRREDYEITLEGLDLDTSPYVKVIISTLTKNFYKTIPLPRVRGKYYQENFCQELEKIVENGLPFAIVEYINRWMYDLIKRKDVKTEQIYK